MLGGLDAARAHRSAEDEAADDARILAFDALEASGKSEKQKLAVKAIETWSGCAEAYIVLAALERQSEKKLQLLETGMQQSRKLIKGTRFVKPDDYFWQNLVTRPYMRSRTALAVALWESGAKLNAINHLKALLELNPYDNQGLRYHLLSWLLDHDASAPDVDKYCAKYEEEASAFGKYACLLWKYSRHGNSPQSHKALKLAVQANQFVPAILCGRVQSPPVKITRVVRGTELEAIAYDRVGGNSWKEVDGRSSRGRY